jgi:hypothetical protein
MILITIVKKTIEIKVYGLVVVESKMLLEIWTRFVCRGAVVVRRDWCIEVDDVEEVVPYAPASSPAYKIKRIIRNMQNNLTFVFSDVTDEETAQVYRSDRRNRLFSLFSDKKSDIFR